MHLNYKVLLHKAEEGGFTVTVPALPGCITEGDNLDEALKRAKEAIELYVRSFRVEERRFLMILKHWNIPCIWQLHEPIFKSTN